MATRKQQMKFDIIKNQSLKTFNTFAVDTKASKFAIIDSIEALESLLRNSEWRDQIKFILGGGSNTLFCQDIDGLMVKLNIKGIEVINEDAGHIWLRIGAGENWHQLVLYCLKHNYAGIENLALIPGDVGAAPIQNIGAYGVELKNCLESVEAYQIADGRKVIFYNNDCQFCYRDSIFKQHYKNQLVITAINIKLDKKPDFHTEYGAIKTTLAEMNIQQLSIQAIAKAIVKIRQSKLPDTKKIPNAGSFFKNPLVSNKQFETLHQRFPTMPHYNVANVQKKIPAAWLIEQCGWKGKRIGNAGVHAKQALVLVNYGGATGEEILHLAGKIQADVKEQFMIDLIPEVTIVYSSTKDSAG